VYEAGGADPAEAARALTALLRERPFELDRELPVRVAVAVADGGIRAAVAVYSHVAADFGAMAVIGRQFAELVADPVSRVTGPRGHQPLDQALAERSDRGRKRAQAALEYWRYQLRRGPQCMFAVPGAAQDDGPPPACWLSSPSAATALRQIAARTGASPSVVTLAALSAVLAHRTANRYCMLVSLASNRADVRLRDYVGSLTQYCLILVDVSTIRFDDLVRRAGTAALRAHRHSLFDADDLEAVHQAVSRSRGTSFDQDFTFNNLSAFGVNPRTWELIPQAAAGAREGALEWWTPRWTPPALLQIEMLAAEPALELALISGDTGRVPRAELTLLLRGIERLLAAAAADDQDLTQLTRITGVEPVARDDDWLYIDSCWVELSATQRLVAEALPGTAPSVFAVRGPRGTPILAAYLVATEAVRTPEQAHSACVRLLPGRHSAMAPGWYVLCASTPADPRDLEGWQNQPELSRGNGRVHELPARAQERADRLRQQPARLPL
jgi:hypothetical protein